MKRFILGSLSLLLIGTTTPAVQAQRTTLGTPSNPAVNPAEDLGSRLAPGTPGAPMTSHRTNLLTTPEAKPKNLMSEEPSADPNITNVQGILGTPSHPAVNPAEDSGSRLVPSTPGAPTTKHKMP